MNFNALRKLLFTNRLSETVFIALLKTGAFPNVVNKLIAGNDLYRKHSVRTFKRNGIMYSLDISDYQAWLIYFMSEKDNSLELLKYLGDSRMIIDVGGNIGQTSLAISKNRSLSYKDFKVIAFEPYPDTYVQFINNLQLNSDIRNVVVENMGVGEVESEVQMYQDCTTNSGGNRISYNPSVHSPGNKTVKITTLDKYVASKGIERIDFIKVDVEGYEYAALKGGESVIKRYYPLLFIELDDDNLKANNRSAKELLQLLVDFGYNRFIRADTNSEIDLESHFLGCHYDIVATR
jgi:FkbM family methyltransferase